MKTPLKKLLPAVLFAVAAAASAAPGAPWEMFDRRVGMFVHWGVYAVDGYHEQQRLRQGLSRAEHCGFPVPCGIYDGRTKSLCEFSITADMAGADEKYHWVRLGKGWVGPEGMFWMPGDWHMTFRFGDWYILRDGLEVDPNWYDVYLSVKFTGPAYRPGSKNPNGIWMDRLLLRRCAPPAK